MMAALHYIYPTKLGEGSYLEKNPKKCSIQHKKKQIEKHI